MSTVTSSPFFTDKHSLDAWLNNYKFGYILSAVPVGDMIGMYDTMHEADISKFINALDERLKNYYTQTALTRLRNTAGLSQSELAEHSGVSIRIIQAYEQRMRDINKAQLATIVNLARALDCDAIDLLKNTNKSAVLSKSII